MLNRNFTICWIRPYPGKISKKAVLGPFVVGRELLAQKVPFFWALARRCVFITRAYRVQSTPLRSEITKSIKYCHFYFRTWKLLNSYWIVFKKLLTSNNSKLIKVCFTKLWNMFALTEKRKCLEYTILKFVKLFRFLWNLLSRITKKTSSWTSFFEWFYYFAWDL